MSAFSDSQLVAKANVIGSQTDENTIDPQMVANMFNDIIMNKWNKDSPLPKGDKGDQGDPGPSAYQEWLDLGNSGTEQDFINSLKGEKGDTGDPGPQGIQGEAGPVGPDGPQGPQGIQGIQGETGPEGPQGPLGPQGNDGLSAYEVWLDQGNTGTEADYLLAIKGDTGDTGPQGPQGIQGETGPEGPQGIQGVQGETGPAGPEGPQGPQGIQGETGPEGPQGPAGADGSPDTPADIVTKLSSITEEPEKLPASAVQSSPYNPDHFEYDAETGAFQVRTVSTPAEGVKGFMTAEDFYNYEQANPRGSGTALWDMSSFREARYNNDFTPRKGTATQDAVIIIGSGGSSGDKGFISRDLIHYFDFTTGWFDNYAIAQANGTIITAGRNTSSGTYMCKRSTDHGKSWTNITLPADSLPYDIATDKKGNWVICCRTTTTGHPQAVYSDDDGLTFLASTVPDENEYMVVVCAGEGFALLAPLGTNKVQYSTDGGATFQPSTLTNETGHFTAFGCAHKGDMFVTSNASGSHNRLLRSQDQGANFDGISNGFDDVPVKAIASVGDYLYVGATDGRLFRSRTGAPGDWQEVDSPVTNEITLITGGIINNIPFVIIGTGQSGERVLINI
ncbi:hypothetical protein [Cyclobacterium sp.]|uniref:hypothetical protein n=1 Tax=Cyclobacterium sp. TaxID=1966343 RepID=UPI0019A8F70B|nr:hypothetical protein [Cyclobacterium sp.]MBD3630503.1 hypothetical protein [Cyclobacterium sp.]